MEHMNPCLKNCGECKYQSECPGCRFNCEHGLCEIAKCASDRGHTACDTCTDRTFCPTLRSAPMMFRHRKEKAEAEAMAKEKRKADAEVMLRWLKPMFTVLLVGYIFGFIAGLLPDIVPPAVRYVTSGITAVFQILHAYYLKKLDSVKSRYGTAAKFLFIAALINIAVNLLTIPGSTALNILGLAVNVVSSVMLLMSVYHEYNTHSDAVVDFDGELAEKWEKLWKWKIGAIIASILASVLSFILGLLAALVILGAVAVEFVIDILALVYLKRMICAVEWDLN